MTRATVRNEHADIAYEYQGSGPLLLLIPGGGGIGAVYGMLAERLAAEYTVVHYDRRCNGRSTGDKAVDLDMAQQAHDAAAVVRAMGEERAYVFGNSGGAIVGLQLVDELPELVTGLVAHEPPVVTILADGEEQLEFHQDVRRAFEQDGPGAAFQLFATRMVGVEAPAPNQPPPIDVDLENFDPNYFWDREHIPFVSYPVDAGRLRDSRVPIVAASGRDSGDAYYARTSRTLTELIGCRYADFPSHHGGFLAEPAEFADALRRSLRAL